MVGMRTEGGALDTVAVQALAANFAGHLLQPGHPGYEEARRVWNGHIDRRPAVIARCSGPADVLAAVRFAREHELPVAVRGGGHAIAGHAVTDGGIVVDLSAMTAVRVDPPARTARIEGGCLNSHLDRETQAFGLATTGGIVSHTGVTGLMLGGGIGHLQRAFGLTVDNVISCDVVTADGSLVVADAEHHPELLWGLRGGGGNFGVVTSTQLRLFPLGPTVLAGMLAWPIEEAPQVLRLLRDLAAEAPEALGMMGNLRRAPAVPALPSELHGRPIAALLLCYAGPVADGEELLRPVRAFGRPVLDTLGPKPYAAFQKALDPAFPHGRHYYWKSHKVATLSDEVIDLLAAHAAALTSPLSTVAIFTAGGAVARVPDDATAYAHRDARHDINIVAAWLPDDPDPDRHVTWVRDLFAALTPQSRGVYVNFTSDDSSERVREAAYGADKWRRLVALKSTYDPDNVFRFNANIPPERSARPHPGQ